MLVSGSDFYCGNSSGSPCQFALKSMIPSAYIHPSEPVCNIADSLPNINVKIMVFPGSATRDNLSQTIDTGVQIKYVLIFEMNGYVNNGSNGGSFPLICGPSDKSSKYLTISGTHIILSAWYNCGINGMNLVDHDYMALIFY